VTDEIKVDYPLMDEMTQTFLQGAEQLQDTMQEMMTIANALEDGALLGRGGTAFTEALRGKLCPAIARLTSKFQELAEDVKKAKEYAQQADQKAKSMF
jgi:WXG100 family type VII secretion target